MTSVIATNDQFLNDLDLIQLTDAKNRTLQKKQLDDMGIPYRTTRTGRPIVTWFVVHQTLLGYQPKPNLAQPEPNFAALGA